MATAGVIIGGALVNAFAFSGTNALFGMLRSSGLEEERKRHDKAMEQLEAAQEEWMRKSRERTDWINEQLKRQGHAIHTFSNVEQAMHEYYLVTGKHTPFHKPQLSDYYKPSMAQRERELIFVTIGIGVTALLVHFI